MHLVRIAFVLLFLKICDAKSSLTFVIDTTGSMYDDIDETIKASKNILKSIVDSKSSEVENFVLITFKDPDVYVSKITKDPHVFHSALTDLSKQVGGGGDCPEYSMTAIETALRNSKRESFIYVFTDASAKDYKRVDIVNQLVQKLQSRVIFVLTGICSTRSSVDYQVYQQVAATSSGQVFHCKKNEVGKVLKSVPIFINGESSVLTSKYLNKGKQTFTFNVDDRTDDVTVSISGEKVKIIRVAGPDKKPLTSYEKIVNLADIKIIKLKSPAPGTYTVSVNSNIRSTVVVNGKTLIDFQQGFSEFKPKSIKDTSRQPIKGQNTRLSVNIEDPNKNFQLKEVQLLTVNETLLKNIPVRTNVDKFYISEPFMPPNGLFKICILGKDKVTGRPIRRLGKTYIEPQKPEVVPPKNKKPIVKIPEGTTVEVEYGSDVKISCQISAYPDPAVTWVDQSGNIITNTATAVELPYDYVSYLKIDKIMKPGKYICNAKNSKGSNYEIVHVNIKSNLKVVEKPKDQSIEIGKDGMLLCKVTSYPPATIKWYNNNKEIRTNDKFSISPDKSQLMLKNVDDKDIGKYKCEIDNGAEKKVLEAKVYVTGMVPPKLDKTVTEIHSKLKNEIMLKCPVLQGNPEPKFSWYYKPKNSRNNISIAYVNKEIKVVTVVSNDRARYTCSAKNYVGQDNVDFVIIVDRPPEISPGTLKLFKPKVGEKVTLPCSVDGEPKPNIKWSRNGRQLTNGNKYSIGPDNSLKFIAEKDDSSPEYECTASNEFGTVKYTAEVSIQRRPELSPGTVKIFQPKVGQKVTLPCSVDVEPKPNIKWSRNGSQLKNGNKYTIGPDNSLKFIAEKDDSSPNYECTASNEFGTAKYTAEVFVQRRPEFSPGTVKLFQPKVGQKVTLPCSVDGEPKPNIKWSRNGRQLTYGNKYTIGPDNSLKFVAEKDDSSPNYECTASNEFGTVKYTAEVYVQKRPEFSLGTIKLFQPKVGQKVTLPCSVDGEPKPNIKWSRNGRQLTNGNKYTIGPDNSLKFVAEKDDSSRNYECTASNEFGTVKYTAEVSVQRRPEFSPGTAKLFQPKVGQKVILPCSVDGEPKPNINWSRNGRQLTNGNKYTIGPDKSLKFVADKDDSSPNYECTASNEFGTVKYTAEVSVQKRPEFSPGTVKLFQPKVGQKVTLPCSVDGEPKPNIKWSRNGRQLTYENKYTIGPDNSLKFVADKDDSSPNYECTASNEFGTVKYTAEVSVQKRPEFSPGTVKLFQPKVGQKVTLPCSVDGEPKPNIKWSRNGRQLTYGNKYTIGPDNSLKFVAEKDDSSPNYECTASNEFGTVKYTAEVSVQRRPEFSPGTAKLFQPKVGQKVTLPCSVDGEPKPNIKWSRNGRQLTNGNKYTIGPDNSLKFIAEKDDSSPNYECTASNEFGTVKYTAEVSVLTHPKISKERTSITVPINNDLNLQCNIKSGNPKPVITWYKKGVTKKLLSVGDNLILPITNINQAGIYYCDAQNSMGNDSHSINVIVAYPPRTNNKESFVEVKQGAEAKLKCEVYGVPKPKINWVRNGYTISDSKYKLEDNVLRFAAQFHDNGTYYCVSYNDYGQLKYKVNLNVLAPAIIVNNPHDNPYVAIIGDYVLKVPCEVEGNPLPKIVWKLNGKVLVADKKYTLDSNMTITIKEPKYNVNFTCFAENIYGRDIRTFQVLVNEFVNIYKDSEHIYLLKGESKHIKCPIKNINDDERWYKNGIKSLTGEFHIKNASVFDDGNYTCRVSNMEGSKSYPLYIDVGWPPKPIYENLRPIIFDGSDQLLHCDVDVKPYPNIRWWKNGEIIENANFETLRIDHWGHYRCFVHSVHGNFSRNFKVLVQDCLIKLDPATDDALVKPLLLTLNSTWLDNIVYKYNNIQSESMVKLTCPGKRISNYINLFKKSQIIAQCKGGDQFVINGIIYNFSKLKCTEDLIPTMKETKETCLDKNSELIKVGFETLSEFVNVYDICIDKQKRIPLYTEMKFSSRYYPDSTVLKYNWTKDLSADVNYNNIYDCNTQRSRFRNIFRKLPKNCCMTKVQLIDPLNMYGPMQLTTFNYLNTVPIWNNCNEKSNWFQLENVIRHRAVLYEGLKVWTGTSGVLKMADESNVSRNIYLDDNNKIPVPLYLWKVLSDVEYSLTLAFIYVNVPNLKGNDIVQYTKCKDISGGIGWMKSIRNKRDQGGYVYSCNFNEFTKAFNISVSIFKLNEYSDYSEY